MHPTLESTLKAIDILNATVNDYRTESSLIDSEILALEGGLKEAKAKRMRLEENVETTKKSIAQLTSVADNLRAALSPVKKLPAEILLKIFRAVVQNSELTLDKHLARRAFLTTTGKDPFVLARVCSTWRGIVMTNASVWPPISIALDTLSWWKGASECVTHWIQACPPARQRLLLVNWTLDGHKKLKELIPDMPVSWKTIHILPRRVPEDRWDIGQFRAKEVVLCRAKPFSIQQFVPLMRYATELTIFGPPPEWETLPWVALRVLTIRSLASATPPALSFDRHSLINLLQAAPHLTDLVLDFTPEEHTSETPETLSATHSKLQSISFHLQYCVTNGRLFGVQLDAPSLRKVTLLSLEHQTTQLDASFYCSWDAPTQLSLPLLEDYELADTAELLRWYPNLESLEVEGPNIDTLFVFMHTLFHHVPPQSEPLPLPRLTSLLITNTDLRGETLVELVENRLRHVRAQTPNIRPITSITMYDSPGVTPSHWSRIQELLEEGGAIRRHAQWRRYGELETGVMPDEIKV